MMADEKQDDQYRETEASCCDGPSDDPDLLKDAVALTVKLNEVINRLLDGLTPYGIEENWGTPIPGGFGMTPHLFHGKDNQPGWTLARRCMREARNVMEGMPPNVVLVGSTDSPTMPPEYGNADKLEVYKVVHDAEDTDQTRGIASPMERMQ